MIRKPVVAGQFYPGRSNELLTTIDSLLIEVDSKFKKQTILAMLPHAGYIYSGKTCGRTLSYASLRENVILLGPNHTGLGKMFAVWDKGRWEFPGGFLEVNEELSTKLIEHVDYLILDTDAHLREHSLEVIIPFLWRLNPKMKIVPICIKEPNLENLLKVGTEIAEVIKPISNDISIIVSSDMSHFISHNQALKQDRLAIDAILDLDPEKLYRVVRQNNITMCGVFPMTVGLKIAKDLGAREAELIEYTTSGEVSGDMSYVVGYAGILIS